MMPGSKDELKGVKASGRKELDPFLHFRRMDGSGKAVFRFLYIYGLNWQN